MPVSVDLGVLVPLMILVSLGICNVSRSLNSDDFLGIKGWRFYPFDRPTHPNLGMMNYLHFGNNTILFFTFSITISSLDWRVFHTFFGQSANLTPPSLVFIVFIVWVLLPLLEFDEYSSISHSDNFNHPKSFGIHLSSVAGISVLVGITDVMMRISEPVTSLSQLPLIDPLRVIGLFPMFLTFSLVLIGPTLFLTELEQELDEIS